MEMQSEEYLEAPVKVLTGKDFLAQFEVQVLTNSVTQLIWDRYDIDGNGVLDFEELRFMLEDITELKLGHRNVDDEVAEAVFTEIDLNGDEQIQWKEWKTYCLQYGIGFGDVYVVKPRKIKGDPSKTGAFAAWN
jgi:hypothetical protein